MDVLGIYRPCDDKEVRRQVDQYIKETARSCQRHGRALVVPGDVNATIRDADRSTCTAGDTDQEWRQVVEAIQLAPAGGLPADATEPREPTYRQQVTGAESVASTIDDVLLCLPTLPAKGAGAQEWSAAECTVRRKLSRVQKSNNSRHWQPHSGPTHGSAPRGGGHDQQPRGVSGGLQQPSTATLWSSYPTSLPDYWAMRWNWCGNTVATTTHRINTTLPAESPRHTHLPAQGGVASGQSAAVPSRWRYADRGGHAGAPAPDHGNCCRLW